MCQGEQLEAVLRLLALMSATGGGVPKKHFDALRREILHTYGHQHIRTLTAMQDAGDSCAVDVCGCTSCKTFCCMANGLDCTGPGLLRTQESSRGSFSAVKKALRLLVDDVDDRMPKDIAYTFSGYAPLSIRLVEVCHNPHCAIFMRPTW